MVCAEKALEVSGLLARGLSQRRAAERARVSRGTVAAIARGVHASQRRSAGECAAVQWGGVYERCPECGGMVRLPCLACQVRASIKRGRARAWTASS